MSSTTQMHRQRQSLAPHATEYEVLCALFGERVPRLRTVSEIVFIHRELGIDGLPLIHGGIQPAGRCAVSSSQPPPPLSSLPRFELEEAMANLSKEKPLRWQRYVETRKLKRTLYYERSQLVIATFFTNAPKHFHKPRRRHEARTHVERLYCTTLYCHAASPR